ncbi:hypothetical protein [Massilia sp. DWR3-1-1]|uniref:hypothetical protein n=1 Tax=Massilia sp. DWR3-1-1 TaxID=2804559 RepID=UPI003CEB6748
MTTELVFESRSSYQVLRQEGATESEPVISLQLELTGGPNIYAAGAALVNKAAWHMKIHRRTAGSGLATGYSPGRMMYTVEDNRSRCAIEVHQSAGRYAELLDMFKGGYVSEITVVVEGLTDKADYSKSWDTAAGKHLTIKAICFEFPLPQSEG